MKTGSRVAEPVRIALVGLGGHGRTIQDAAEAAANLRVVAVYDPDEAEAQAAAVRFGCERAASYEALVARRDLEAVVLVTPNHLHRAQAEAALAAGLDVFVEKPVASTVADGRAMVEAAEARGRLLMVGHNMRRSRSARMARRLLEAGRTGELVSVEFHFSTDNTRRLSGDAWRLRPGQVPLLPVMQLGIHAVDLVHYLVGPIREVFAFARAVTTRPEVTDSVTAAFCTEQGVLGALVCNYCTQMVFDLRIAGTEAMLHLTPHRLWFRRNADTDGRSEGPAEAHDFLPYERESYVLQMEAFGEAVRTRTPPETDGWGALQALAVVEALHRSAREQTLQRVPLFKSESST